jgi:hypothetical protein
LQDSMSHGVYRSVIACFFHWDLERLEWGLCCCWREEEDESKGVVFALLIPCHTWRKKNEWILGQVIAFK